MNGKVALGGATENEEWRVRFGTAVIGVDEQDFIVTYDAATNSWTAKWKWSQDGEPGTLRNKVVEYSVPSEARMMYEDEL